MKKLVKIFPVLLMMMSLFVGLLGMQADAAEGTANVTLHKRIFDILPDSDIQNDGSIMPDFLGKPLNGVEFTLYDVTDAYYDLIENDSLSPENAGKKIIADVKDYQVNKISSGVTATVNGQEGVVVFENLDLEKNGKDAVYLFVETKSPANIKQKAAPIVLQMPIFKKDSTEINRDIHLYPKNLEGTSKKELANSDKFEVITINGVPHYNVTTGDTLEYAVTIDLPADLGDMKVFEIKDTASPGLKLNADSVAIQGLQKNTHYTVASSGDNEFKIVFDMNHPEVKKLTGELEVTYTATVTAINTSLNNSAELNLDNELHKIPGPKVVTGGFEFKKTNSHTGDGLAGAEFIVELNGSFGIFEQTQAGEYNFKEWTKNKADATTLVSGPEGKLILRGLLNADYILHETKAPTGYLIIEDQTDFTVVANTTGKIELGATIKNTPGGGLPSTGGNGIVYFLAIGVVMMVGGYIWHRRTKETADV